MFLSLLCRSPRWPLIPFGEERALCALPPRWPLFERALCKAIEPQRGGAAIEPLSLLEQRVGERISPRDSLQASLREALKKGLLSVPAERGPFAFGCCSLSFRLLFHLCFCLCRNMVSIVNPISGKSKGKR